MVAPRNALRSKSKKTFSAGSVINCNIITTPDATSRYGIKSIICCITLYPNNFFMYMQFIKKFTNHVNAQINATTTTESLIRNVTNISTIAIILFKIPVFNDMSLLPIEFIACNIIVFTGINI